MRHLLFQWIVLSFAVWVTAKLLPKMEVDGVVGAIIVAALFGLLNFFVGWLFFVLIGIGTLGLGFLFAFVTRWLVGAIMLKFTAALTPRLSIQGFGTAFVAALIISGVGTLVEVVLRRANI